MTAWSVTCPQPGAAPGGNGRLRGPDFFLRSHRLLSLTARSSHSSDGPPAAAAYDFSILSAGYAITINLNTFLVSNRKQKYMRKEIKELMLTSEALCQPLRFYLTFLLLPKGAHSQQSPCSRLLFILKAQLSGPSVAELLWSLQGRADGFSLTPPWTVIASHTLPLSSPPEAASSPCTSGDWLD